jgi:hypothetical protein
MLFLLIMQTHVSIIEIAGLTKVLISLNSLWYFHKFYTTSALFMATSSIRCMVSHYYLVHLWYTLLYHFCDLITIFSKFSDSLWRLVRISTSRFGWFRTQHNLFLILTNHWLIIRLGGFMIHHFELRGIFLNSGWLDRMCILWF